MPDVSNLPAISLALSLIAIVLAGIALIKSRRAIAATDSNIDTIEQSLRHSVVQLRDKPPSIKGLVRASHDEDEITEEEAVARQLERLEKGRFQVHREKWRKPSANS